MFSRRSSSLGHAWGGWKAPVERPHMQSCRMHTSIPLKRCCFLTTCLVLGSFCLAHASPSASADCSGPTQEGCSPACRVTSRWGCPGELCMTPRTCCLSILAHGVPIWPVGRIDRPDILLAFIGSKYQSRLQLGQNEPVIEVDEYTDSHLSQRRESHIHASCESAGSQGQPQQQDLVLISHPFDCESQESSVMGGYLDVKVYVF